MGLMSKAREKALSLVAGLNRGLRAKARLSKVPKVKKLGGRILKGAGRLLKMGGRVALGSTLGTAGAIAGAGYLAYKGVKALRGMRARTGMLGIRRARRSRIGFKRSDLKAFRRVMRTARQVNKILGKAKVSRYVRRVSGYSSPGIITRVEALSALRR